MLNILSRRALRTGCLARLGATPDFDHGLLTHPREILPEEFLKPLEMTQAAAAQKPGMSTVRLNEVVRSKRGVTADTALWRDCRQAGPAAARRYQVQPRELTATR